MSRSLVKAAQLSAFCALANKAIRKDYGRPDCCVFATGVCVEVLTHFGIKAEPLRVEAAIFPNDRKHHGVVLGSFGDGSRQPAAAPDKWRGHLCTLVADVYLLDTTFDQVNVGRPDLRAEPLVIDLRRTKWFDPEAPYDCDRAACRCSTRWYAIQKPKNKKAGFPLVTFVPADDERLSTG